MELFEYLGRTRRALGAADIPSLAKPVMLYLGCLNHIRDQYINDQFYSYIDRLKGGADVHVIAPVFRMAEQDVLRTLRQRFNDAMTGPGDEARSIYELFVAPRLNACPDFTDTPSLTLLQDDLSRISMVGYSYGTSLLQQIADVMAGDMMGRLAGDPEAAAKAYDLCRHVKAVAIGPTGRLRVIGRDDATRPLPWDDAAFGIAPTIFSQMLFLMRHDMVTQGAYGDEPLGGRTVSETGVEFRRTRAAMLVIDHTPAPVMKVVGVQRDADGTAMARVWQTPDTLIHDHRAYTYMHERQGDFMLPQTLAMTPVLRSATRAMVDPGLHGPDWIDAMEHAIAGPEQRSALTARRDASNRETDLLIDQVACAPGPLKAGVVEGYLDGFYTDAIAAARDDLNDLSRLSTDFWRASLAVCPNGSAHMTGEVLDVFQRGLGQHDRAPIPAFLLDAANVIARNADEVVQELAAPAPTVCDEFSLT